MEPVVSVLVTVYNREKYLESALRSILRSRFRSFEIVVVDDCSRDNSLAVAQRLAQEDSRVRVFANEKNLGDYGNRMRAASLARGRYLKYVDSDDLIYPHSLGVMVEAIESGTGVGLALSHSAVEAEEPYPWLLMPAEAWRMQFLGRGCLSCGPTGAIISRDAFLGAGGFRREWGVLSDIDLWLRLAARHPVVLMPPGLVWWRRHEGQEFTAGGAAWRYLTDGYRLLQESLSSSECPLTAEERERALSRGRQHHARRLLSLALRQREFRAAFSAYQLSRLPVSELIRGFRRYC